MRTKKRLLSYLLAALMIFSTVFAAPLVKANAAVKGFDASEILKSHAKNLKDYDYTKALAQKFGQSISDDNTAVKENTINPDDEVRVIVEVNYDSVYDMANGKKLADKERKNLEAKVENTQKPIRDKVQAYGKIRHSYKDLLNGFSAEVKYQDIDNIRNISGVKKVTICNAYNLDMNTARSLTNVETVWQDLGYKGEGTVIAIVDTGIDYDHKDMKITDESKVKLTEEKVAAIEGPGKYYTLKVPYGYNFADMNDNVKDIGPGASMHGMHVSGIAAANGSDEEVANNKAIKGVAPEAQLLAMKVFSNNPDMPSAYDDDIAAAIEDSVNHGADVINMSLGSTAGFVSYDDPEQEAIQNASNMGTVVVVSAGNSSYSTSSYYNPYYLDPDMGLVGSPGLVPESIQVASSENSNILLSALDYTAGDDNSGKVPYYTSEIDPVGVLNGAYELVDCGFGNPSDFENKDLKGKIALIQRGAITFVEKKLNAQSAGAAGVIIYNKDNTYLSMATDPSVTIPCIFITNSDGLLLKSLIPGIKVSFNGAKFEITNINGGKISDYSSWGTTPSLGFKPEVTAPGGNIYSTVNNNKYEVMSGTSMAAPHTSGASALVVQYLNSIMPDLKGIDKVNLVRKLLVNSAEPIIDPATKLPYLTRNQGAGLIKVDKAIKTKAYAEASDGKAVIELKEIGNTTNFAINVKNFGDKDLTFNVVNNYGVLSNYIQSGFFLPNPRKTKAALSFDNTEITVPAGGSTVINATLSIPESSMKNIFYEGFITLTEKDNNNPSIGIPFMGFYGKWSGEDGPRMLDAPVWDWDNTFFGITTLLDGDTNYLGYMGWNEDNNIPIIDPDKIAFSPNGDGSSDTVMPLLSFMRNAKEFKVEIVDGNGKLVRDISLDTNIKKNYESPFYKFNYDWAWDGKVYDNKTNKWTTAPEGQYYVRLLAKPDYEGADWYTLDMPVKLDVTAPEFTAAGNMTDVNKYTLNVTKVSDDISFYAAVILDNKGDKIGDTLDINEGENIIDVPNGNYTILVAAFDYAGNVKTQKLDITNKSIIFKPVDSLLTVNKVKINYTISEDLLPLVDHIGVTVNNGTEENIGLVKSYEMKDLADGKYIVVFKLYDKDNKLIAQGSVNFAVDTAAPVINVTDPASALTLTKGEESYTIKGNIVEAGSSYTLYINGQKINKFDPSDNAADFSTAVNLVQGENKFTLTAVDSAGHTSQPVEVTINMSKDTTTTPDTTVPTLSAFDKDGQNISEGNAYAVSVLDIHGTLSEEVKYLNIYVGDNKMNVNVDGKNFTSTLYFNEGINRVTFEMEDLAGNKNSYQAKIWSDTKAPEVTFITPTTDVVETNSSTYEIKMHVSDATMGYRLYINGNQIDYAESESGEGVSKDVSYVYNVPNGKSTVVIKAVDLLGNSYEKTITFKKTNKK